MAAGKINLQANDGAVIGLVVPDGLTSGERQISLGANLSGTTAYHLLQGNLAVSNSTITKGFGTTLYTSGSAVTDIDMDTQWGNTAEEKFGGLVWLKDRVEATNNFLYDTTRGATKEINSNTAEAEATLAGGLTAFNSTGFTVGADTGHNSTTNNMVSWNFQTTHRVSGTTNHGKPYTCHFNPFTGFTIVKYEGSGIAGHEIPHMLGRKLGLYTHKNLSAVASWTTQYKDGSYLSLNLNNAETSYTVSTCSDNSVTVNTENTSTNQYIMYGWANSYFDESNKLIGNYELVTYQGTGIAGNKVKTKGKPAWVMVKRLDSVGDWYIWDNQRDTDLLKDHYLVPNQSVVESVSTTFGVNFLSDGFSCNDGQSGNNASGGQYIALVAYDTNASGGGSYYPLASDTANVQINNALIPLAQGIDGNGVKNTILSKNETITGLTYTQGKNYVYCDKNGSYGVSRFAPQYNSYNGFGDYFDVNKNQWFSDISVFSDDFNDNNVSDWTSINCTLHANNGKVTLNGTVAGAYAFKVGITVVKGKKYRAVLDARSSNTDNARLALNIGSGQYQEIGTSSQGNGILTMDFIANGTTIDAIIAIGSVGISTFDNYAIYPINNDGSVDTSNATEITNSRNYLNHIVHADNDGGVLYVEELPKIEYKDIVKANEFRGKNSCTAWVNFDGTTTPPTIRDSYNIGAVIRLTSSIYDIYFKENMDNLNYSVFALCNGVSGINAITAIYTKYSNKVSVVFVNPSSNSNLAINPSDISIHIDGGKN